MNAYPTDCGGFVYVGAPKYRVPSEPDLAMLFEGGRIRRRGLADVRPRGGGHRRAARVRQRGARTMSQHLATATLDGHPVEIVAGFDRRLGTTFSRSSTSATTCSTPACRSPAGLDRHRNPAHQVAELGLRLPAKLVDEVEGDGRRRAGNRIVRHLADGPPVTLLAG